MTKEKFLSNIGDMCTYGGDILVLNEFAKEFFDSNVCIPKGENRHPYAEVLHEWAEDISICIQYCNENGGWVSAWCPLASKPIQYRIKPSEPVYEYLWYTNDGNTNWMTIEEAKMTKIEWYCATETKRVRNA